ncbi:MAG: carboxypeptidase regulatory-like domain-containing protein [Myxococcales bacterium]|nr:carboxypeptidase regulatory-like domain-containing protein [Myxococcales bacterium]
MNGDRIADRSLRRRLWLRDPAGTAALGELGLHELRALARDRLRIDRRIPLLPLRDPEPHSSEGPLTAIHWIEIELIDEADAPIAGVRYELKLPNGRVQRGVTDADGRVRVDGIRDVGQCELTFPELDQEAWEPA